jgi:MFS family permease
MDPQAELQRSDSYVDNEKKIVTEHLETVNNPSDIGIPEYQTYSIGRSVRVFWRSTLVAVGLGLGASFDCLALVTPNSIVANPGFIRDFGTVLGPEGFPVAMSPQDLSNWNLATGLGSIAGLAIGGTLGDRYGRKVVLYLCTTMLTIAIVLSVAVKPGFTAWTVRAVFTGLSQGLLQGSLVPYLSEIAPPKIRGMFLSMYSFFWGIGILVGSIALYVSAQVDPMNWKGAFYAQFVLLGLFLPALVLAPETPWFLARRGNRAKAEKSMRFLYGNVPSYDIAREYADIVTTIEAEKAKSTQSASKQSEWRLYLDCFRGTHLRRTLVAILPIVTQSFAGVILFYGYTVYFFQQAGYPKPFEANLIFGIIQLAGVGTSFVVLDRFGRRPTMILGTTMCAICCWALGGIAYQAVPNGKAMASLACIWVFFYSTSLGPLGYNYIGEVPTQRLKSKTAAIGFALYAGLSLMFAYLAPYMLSPLEWGWGLKIGELAARDGTP